MEVLLTILIVIAAIILIFLVLVQNSKGGGLASGFTSGNQVMGAPRTADFLEKASWTLAAVIVVLSVLTVGVKKGTNDMKEAKSAMTNVPMDEDASQQAPAADYNAEQGGNE